MAKGAYLGIGDTARKVKNIYVGAGVNTYQKTVTATEFQQGALLYSSGNLDTSFTDYVSTTNFYEASYGNVVKIISSKVTPLEDSGFLWYDSNHNFISGNKGTVSGQFVSGEPPVNTAYFKFNLNAASVTPSTASGTGFAVYSVARKIKKAYIGDENGLARLCWSSEVPFVYGTTTVRSGRTITINNLDIEPIYVMALKGGDITSYNFGVCGDIPSTNRLTTFKGGGTEIAASTSTKAGSGIQFSDGTLTITNNAASGYSFGSGKYNYIVVGSNENAVYGTQTISSNSSSISINVGTGKTIKSVIVFGSSTGNDYSNFMYAQVNDTTYISRYGDFDGDGYEEYKFVATVTNPYSYSSGNVVIKAPTGTYSSSYWRDGTIYYCIAFE